MQSLKLHIVGFPYRKNIEGHVSEFLSDAPGHGMTLRPQRNNEVDVHAKRTPGTGEHLVPKQDYGNQVSPG